MNQQKLSGSIDLFAIEDGKIIVVGVFVVLAMRFSHAFLPLILVDDREECISL